MIKDLDKILVEWSYRTSDGKPDVNNSAKLILLEKVLDDFGWSREARAELLSTLMEAPKQKGDKIDPETKVKYKIKDKDGKDVDKETTYKSAISREKDSPAYIAAKALQKGDDKKDGEKLDEPSEFDRDVDSNKGISQDFKRNDSEKSSIVGDTSEGDNQVKSDMFKYGYGGYEKATGSKPAPGGAGSAFNEIMSGEGVRTLEENTNMTEEELARDMYEKTKDTVLGKEQKQTAGIGKKDTPEDIDNPKLWSKCLVSARSAKKKHEQTQQRIESLQEQKKFGEPKKTSTFYGAKSSIDAQVSMVENSNKVLLPNGQEATKEDAITFIKAGGGGINPSDTATFVEDDNGNLLIQFHSDKTTTNDIQDNSTLSQEGENYKQYIDGNENLSDSEKQEAKNTVDKYANKMSEIEENYNNQAVPVAKTLLEQPPQKVSEVLKDNPQGAQKNIRKSLFGTKEKPPTNSKFEKYLPEGKTLEDELSVEEQYDMVLKYASDGNKLTNEVTKSINKVALAYKQKNSDIDGLDVKKNLSEQRKKVVGLQRERLDKLNQLKSGLGNNMEAKEASRAFHLSMMDYPPKEYEAGNPNSMMGAALDVNMGGNIVNGEVLRECLGVKSSKEFEGDFNIVEDDKITTDTDGNVTGKVVFTYVVDKEGKRTEVGYKTYRSKNGAAGKTDNTMTYSNDMQKCFKGKK
tara:strand:+ start:1314 stop:3380 length:2067 start_codon:yes stop_codon:yes gene_type:complete